MTLKLENSYVNGPKWPN